MSFDMRGDHSAILRSLMNRYRREMQYFSLRISHDTLPQRGHNQPR